MNKEQADGKMTQLKGELQKVWGKITDNDYTLLRSQRNEFLGKVKEYYGISKEEAERKLKSIEDACGCSDSSKAA